MQKTLELECISQSRSFGGTQSIYQHYSMYCNTKMKFAIFLPKESQHTRVPLLWFLPSMSTTAEESSLYVHSQKYAAERGLAIITPDTSPRNTFIRGENREDYIGNGAGFYLDASRAPWCQSYNMYSYLLDELQSLVQRSLPIDSKKQAITGNSMGGHGALTIGLKHSDIFSSVSAFAPICAPSKCIAGKTAFTAYLGTDKNLWNEYDATALILNGSKCNKILIDQGSDDKNLNTELNTDLFAIACDAENQELSVRIQQGYDDSYSFINSFIEDHINFHATNFEKLNQSENTVFVEALSDEMSMTIEKQTENSSGTLDALSEEINSLEDVVFSENPSRNPKKTYKLK